MHWTCNQCRHEWDEGIDEGMQVVMCPSCFAIVPVVLAGGKDSAPPEPVKKTIVTKKPAVAKDSTTVGGNLTGDNPGPLPTSTNVTVTPMKTKPVVSSPKPLAAAAASKSDPLIGRTIGGYRIESLLGRGGMGAVYLAHQISLDRKIALKILPAEFASNADMLARFTREAMSAGHLSHHNVVQVFDVGSDDHIYFISMEYVPGQTLADMIKSDGRLPIDDATGYVLQVARGLQYAHERGIVHRDIKPANLMINDLGYVKIADMGLAKKLGTIEKGGRRQLSREALQKLDAQTELTQADVAMGTPAYMSPEQARDAASVDARADQYSLGCTLYYLCAGQAPYQGTTAFELITKHLREAFTPLEAYTPSVPPAINKIIARMLDRKPEGRYSTMNEVVKDLEAYLGLDSDKGPYRPREQHMAILETQQKNYYSVPTLKTRRAVTLGFLVAMPLVFLTALFGKQFSLAGGFLGLFVLTLLGNFIVDGVITKAFLFRRVRSLFFGMPLKSWAIFITSSLLTVAVLWVIGWLVAWLDFSVLAMGLAVGYQWFVVKKLHVELNGPIDKTQEMLRELRLRGVSEDALQDFVSRFSGVHWEQYFEDLFGYKAMVFARVKLATADEVIQRKRYATWREPVAHWLDEVEQSRKRGRERKQLAKIEAQRFKATGMDEAAAQ
jgi:serine/threonine protein kinase